MNPSRDKGSREERAFVNYLREEGIECQRTLESGARNDGSPTWDIDIYYKGREHAPLIGECKHRKVVPNYIYEWLGENDFLTIRPDRKPRLVVMSEEMFVRLMKEAG